jgi:methylenetetrahydrofolate dehydrogenase (NADP+)/methenyltetrahydrofolate cyclohydrolase
MTFETKIIDGRSLASDIQAELAEKITRMNQPPRLLVIIVGDDPASSIYVRNKARMAARIGMASEVVELPATTTEEELAALIKARSARMLHGLIVQLPLPAHIRYSKIMELIPVDLDVDGFHPLNAGRLGGPERHHVPCTPKGIMRMLEATQTSLVGAKAVVVGTSAIVGRPVATLLSQAGATVTSAHRQTRDLPLETRQADIIVSAAGCPNLIRAAMIKPGATLIDVGINRLPNGRLVGDIAYEECLGIAGAITPVPGGVGPMTVACLLENTVDTASLTL